MFDYPHLRVLQAVEREKSFERAAKSLGVTKSAVSQTLRLLEERMGAVVVDRYATELTTFGARLCRHLEHVHLLEQRFFRDQVDRFGPLDQDPITISIAVDDDSLSTWFSDVVDVNCPTGPGFGLDITVADEHAAFSAMHDGRASAAVSTGEDHLSGFHSYELGHLVYRAVASPEFVKTYFPDGLAGDALSRAPSVRYSAQDNKPEEWMTTFSGEAVGHPTHRVRSSPGIVQVCLSGAAWGLNPAPLVNHHIQSGTLVELKANCPLRKPVFWHVNQQMRDVLEPLTMRVRALAERKLAHGCDERKQTVEPDTA